jgi:hypothetical protein
MQEKMQEKMRKSRQKAKRKAARVPAGSAKISSIFSPIPGCGPRVDERFSAILAAMDAVSG